ncbi:2',5' RNA ligase family [Posidoniimonas polymericola]|uniref:RNA 2',3'-cyclic phosphodiesterase n=1 Tax=Posidoniimonas polymericola TaxID=2528002 RepID=A0A5C5YR32_9BACT|nr:RNA 2',3'-cyclic phosphodiesterase [Posidoniimonas polymericola]TWT77376.1 2',5' RNA ligase family [Posidoniimonas polymericola]
MKTRTFIAVEASAEVRTGAVAAKQRLAAHGSDYRWVEKENLHFTLQFLGDITDQEIVDVCGRVTAAVEGFEPFEIAAQGVGAFPSADRPKTLWVGVGEGGEPFTELHAAIDDQLADLGFRGENRRYVPHLTIGRLIRNTRPSRELADQLSSLADFEAGKMLVDAVTVFASQLRPDGPEYHVLARVTL